jgi:hypothetical protein
MSIEIWQFPQAATKTQLIRTLKTLGFVVGENVFKPGPPGTISLFWSEPTDFKSTSGVDASVFHLDDEAKSTWETTTDWGLRTRTSIWASSFDKEFQNAAVRKIRHLFGGTFYNDHAGRNRYIVVARAPSTPASRGIYGVVTRLEAELENLKTALPEDGITSLCTPGGLITPAADPTGVLRVVRQFDPSRVVYNGLVPFLVSALEYFFRECFEILLKYDAAALLAVRTQNRKIPFTEVLELSSGRTTLEQIASGWYSFQNFDSIQKAYSEVLGIDVWKILRRRKKIRSKLPMLSAAFQNLIGARHGVVHHFSLDRQLDREGFLGLLGLVQSVVEQMAAGIERKLGIPIGPG